MDTEYARCYESKDTHCGLREEGELNWVKICCTRVEIIIPFVHTIWFKGKKDVLPEDFTGEW